MTSYLCRFIPFGTWRMFSDTFSAVWGASAFKGAFGETLIVPDANMHLENNVAWLEVIDDLIDFLLCFIKIFLKNNSIF